MRVLWISILIVLLDQASKAAVVRTMHRGETIPVVGDWLRFTFTENPGMAFGLQFFSRQSMAMLALVVTVLLFWYLFSVRGGYTPYIASLALVLGGAVGNVIDRALYGRFLGYGQFLEGKVVDFIHVDVWRGYLPEFLPWVGGAYLPLFPIWNVADMAIVVGVVGILVFQRRFHRIAFEEPRRDRQRLRELEQEREREQTPAPAGTAASTAGATAGAPHAPTAEQPSTPAEAAPDSEPTDGEPTDGEPTDGESVDGESSATTDDDFAPSSSDDDTPPAGASSPKEAEQKRSSQEETP